MMSRRARPSARTTRTAPTAPCVPVDRDGAPVPRSIPPDAGPVTGNGSCTSVEGGSERSTGSPGGPHAAPGLIRGRLACWRSPSGSGWPWSPSRSTWPPGPIASTTTSCGRRPHSSRARPRSATRSEALAASVGNAYFQDVLPVVTTRRRAARAAAVPAAAGGRRSCRSSRCGAWRPTTSCSSRSWPRWTSRICWWMLGRLRTSAVDPRWRRRCSSPSARSSGTPRSWPRPGTRRTSSRSGWRCSPVGLAIGADPAADDEPGSTTPPRRRRRAARRPAGAPRVAPRQLLAGLLFGLACTARLTSLFAAPFFMLVGGGRGWWRRGAGRPALGAAIPVGAAAGLQRRLDRPGHPSRLRLPVSARDARRTRASATTPTGPSRIRATCPRTSGSCCS